MVNLVKELEDYGVFTEVQGGGKNIVDRRVLLLIENREESY